MYHTNSKQVLNSHRKSDKIKYTQKSIHNENVIFLSVLLMWDNEGATHPIAKNEKLNADGETAPEVPWKTK